MQVAFLLRGAGCWIFFSEGEGVNFLKIYYALLVEFEAHTPIYHFATQTTFGIVVKGKVQ